ncbi:ATP-binding protein [Microbacterium sp. LS_15]|uniref:AAA family ATPase n=1 Tax=Microbacterium sp. LS_15 TaxID=3055790 RepID=UPI0035C14FEE
MTTAVAPLLILMCGLSFSGKSTLALELRSRLDVEVLSLDVINAERGLYGGQGISGEEWQKTHQIAQARALHTLTGGRSVIIDDTASRRFLRDAWREIAIRAAAQFRIICLDIDPLTQQDRLHANRATPSRHDVVDRVIAEHRASFEPPLDENAIRVDARNAHEPDTINALVHALDTHADPQA